jgi:hypothetical protein
MRFPREEEEKTMYRRCYNAILFTTLTILLASLALSSSARADMILARLGEDAPQPDKRISITSPNDDSTHPTAPLRLEVQLARSVQLAGFRAFLNRHEATHKLAPAGQGNGQAGAEPSAGDSFREPTPSAPSAATATRTARKTP